MHHPVALRMSIFAHRVPLLEYKFSARSTAWILSQFFNIVRIFDWLSYNSGVCRIKINADLTCMYLVESLLEISIISLLGSYFGRYLVHSVSDWLRIKFSEKAGPTSWYEKKERSIPKKLSHTRFYHVLYTSDEYFPSLPLLCTKRPTCFCYHKKSQSICKKRRSALQIQHHSSLFFGAVYI